MNPVKDELSDDVKKMIETFQKFAKADWQKQSIWGIKPSEVRVLVCIKKINGEDNLHGVNVSQISKMLFVTSPTVTQMIKSLSNNGYIERFIDPEDRRIADIRLTEKGQILAQKAIDRHKEIFSGLLVKLGKEKSDALNSLLDEVYLYFVEASKIR